MPACLSQVVTPLSPPALSLKMTPRFCRIPPVPRGLQPHLDHVEPEAGRAPRGTTPACESGKRNIRISLENFPLEKLSLEKFSLEKLSLEKLSLEKFSLEKLSLEKLSLEKFNVFFAAGQRGAAGSRNSVIKNVRRIGTYLV